MDFALLRDRLILGARMVVALEFSFVLDGLVTKRLEKDEERKKAKQRRVQYRP